MRLRPLMLVGVAVLLWPALSAARNVRVSADGSADFRTVQAAVDSLPPGNTERIVIHLRNGVYREQLRIHNSFITLRGESRAGVRIEAEVNTSACPVAEGESKEEHCATIVAEGSDLVFENLTVVNTWKAARGKGAALSVVGDSTRTVLSNVNVVGSGGDTLVLSARRWRLGDGAEYYLRNVQVSGTYHILVPRGTAYATHCRFVCMGRMDNCLFAEGLTRESDKLVIRNSTIAATVPFRLGSYFRDAAWYFVDDRISPLLARNGEITREPAKDYSLKWGEGRIYFSGNGAPQYPWLRDNIASSPAGNAAAITAQSTLPDWNPENTVPPMLLRVEASDHDLRVVFSESVTVEGQPVLRCASGENASYISGSGTTTLVFERNRPSQPGRLQPGHARIFASGASLNQRVVSIPKRLPPATSGSD